MNRFFSKKYVLNVLFLLCFTFGFTFLTHVNASAATTSASVWQSAATTNSITLNWTARDGAINYKIIYSPATSYSASSEITTTNTSIVINGLNQNTRYDFAVYTGYMYESSVEYSYYSSCYDIPTLPKKVSGVGIDYYWSSLKEVDLAWDRIDSADGYQIQLYDGKKIKSYSAKDGYYSSIFLKKINLNKFYKARVRAYTIINGENKYGEYSSWYYFSQQPELTVKNTSNGMNVSWSKVSGATNYTVYVSTKQKSGYKKVGTVTKPSATVKKCGSSKLKSGKTYYFYVVANKKVGTKTYKSGDAYCWSKKYK